MSDSANAPQSPELTPKDIPTNPDRPIINCHVHLFTTSHTPHHFPVKAAVLARRAPWLVKLVRQVTSVLPYEHWYDYIARLEAFHNTGQRLTQRDVLRELRHYYPSATRFVVLPLDLAHSGFGPVDKPIHEQHNELAELSRDYPDNLIPFANIHPDAPGAEDEFMRCIEDLNFKGLKLYPKTGYAPTHPLLMEKIYPYCEANRLPVLSHCSRGGVYRKGWDQAQRDKVTEPYAYREVLGAFPNMPLCLAHYGGLDDWKAYIDDGFDPEVGHAKDLNWVHQINNMITSGAYENLWTDISYTMFRTDAFAPLFKLLLEDEKIRARVLFGSDFYMTRQEALSEKAVSLRLRVMLGERLFSQIAMDNPRVWLGED